MIVGCSCEANCNDFWAARHILLKQFFTADRRRTYTYLLYAYELTFACMFRTMPQLSGCCMSFFLCYFGCIIIIITISYAACIHYAKLLLFIRHDVVAAPARQYVYCAVILHHAARQIIARGKTIAPCGKQQRSMVKRC